MLAISRSELIAEVRTRARGLEQGTRRLIFEIAERLEILDQVDVVHVVRCKDCRFCKKHPTSDKVKMCTNEQQWGVEYYPLVHDDDFCSYGERRNDG